MRNSFEHKAQSLQREILSGKLGCFFGMKATEHGDTKFANFGSRNTRTEAVQSAISEFARSESLSVLVGIPREQPQTFEEGRAFAMQLYAEYLLAVKHHNWEVIEELITEGRIDLEPILQQIGLLNIPESDIREGLKVPEFEEEICNGFPYEGFAAPIALKKELGADLLIPFTVAPYYTPLRESHPHPRYAPHFATIFTWDSYIQAVYENPACHQHISDIHDWTEKATGKLYAQGYHIDQDPKGLSYKKVQSLRQKYHKNG